MVGQVHVQVTIFVIVKKSSLNRVARIIQAIFPRTFLECIVTLVNKKQVCAVFGLKLARATGIKIRQAIIINVHHGYARIPACFPGNAYPRFLCNILKSQVSFVEIKAKGPCIG